MPRSKDFSEEVRRRVVEAHEAGKGYKTISKLCGLHHSTVRKIVYKWKTFNTISTRPRSGRPTKMATVLRHIRRIGARAAEEELEEESENEIIKVEVLDVNAEGDALEAGADSAGLAVGEDEASVTPLIPDVPAHTRKTKKRKEKLELDLRGERVLGPASAERHVEVMLCCEICGTCFTTETDLESHQAQHLDKTLHACQECGKVFQSAAGLRVHRKRQHGC